MSGIRPKVLVIGGFDPSGGAGVMADVKTLEQHKVYGMAVNTANTVQHESAFLSVNWLGEQLILEQLDVLIEQYTFKHAKIGLVPSIDTLKKLLGKLNKINCHVIWDPVLKASAGFDFDHDLKEVKGILSKIFLVTPNWDEVKQIAGKEGIEGAKSLSTYCHIFLKGGHNKNDPGRDYLIADNSVQNYKSKMRNVYPKHGSGCVLASAIAANLALGYKLPRACMRAKQYTERFLTSNDTLLGFHKR